MLSAETDFFTGGVERAGVVPVTFNVWASAKVYRMPFDDEDRTMAAGSPFRLAHDGAPGLTRVATSVAIAMAMREVNAGTSTAVLQRDDGAGRPRRPR